MPAYSPCGQITGVLRSCYSAPARWYEGGPVGRIRFYFVPVENGFLTGTNRFFPLSQLTQVQALDGVGELTTEKRRWTDGRPPCAACGQQPAQPVGTAADFAGLGVNPGLPGSGIPAALLPRCDHVPGLGLVIGFNGGPVVTGSLGVRIGLSSWLYNVRPAKPGLQLGVSVAATYVPSEETMGLCLSLKVTPSRGVARSVAPGLQLGVSAAAAYVRPLNPVAGLVVGVSGRSSATWRPPAAPGLVTGVQARARFGTTRATAPGLQLGVGATPALVRHRAATAGLVAGLVATNTADWIPPAPVGLRPGISAVPTYSAGLTDPTSVADCVLYFRVDTGAYQDTALTTLCNASAQKIAGVFNFAGNGIHGTSSTTANRPTYETNVFGGKAGALFDGADDRWLCDGISAFFTGTDMPATVFAVVKVSSTPNLGQNFAVLALANTNSSSPHQQHGFTGVSGSGWWLQRRDGAPTTRTVNAGGLDVATTAIICWRSSGTAADVLKNGIALVSGADIDVANVSLNSCTVGCLRSSAGASNFGNFRLGVLLAYARRLTDTEVYRVGRWLQGIWAPLLAPPPPPPPVP